MNIVGVDNAISNLTKLIEVHARNGDYTWSERAVVERQAYLDVKKGLSREQGEQSIHHATDRARYREARIAAEALAGVEERETQP